MNKIDILINVASVIVSGIISWLISFLYYRKGNKDLLHRGFIYPFIKELNDPKEISSFSISKIRKSEYVKILTNKEYKLTDDMLKSIKEIKSYSVYGECCNSLFEYFLWLMEDKDICITHLEFIYDDEGEFVDQNEVLNFEKSYFEEDIISVLHKYPLYMYDEFINEMDDSLNKVLNNFLLENKVINEKIEFFENTNISRIFERSITHKEWLEKFQDFQTAKSNLFETKNFKRVIKDYKIDITDFDYYNYISEHTFKLK